MYIKSSIEQFIADGGPARIVEQNGQAGVLFTDENEFIPWGDLGYNADLGYFQRSLFPDVHDESGVHFQAVKFRENDGEDDYTMWAVCPDDYTDSLIIGEWGTVVHLYHVLKRLVESGGEAEMVDVLDERLGHPWMTPAEAARFAAERLGISITDRAIRYACERGDIPKASRETGNWRVPQRTFLSWLRNR